MSYNLTRNSAQELRDDLYQEGMLRVFLERPHWDAAHDDGASEIAFCLHKARYAMLDYLRSHGPIARDKRRGADYQTVSLDDEVPDGSAAMTERGFTDAEDRSTVASVLRAVQNVNPRLAWIGHEHYIKGRPVKDISHELTVTESRVSQLKAQFLKCARTTLSEPANPDQPTITGSALDLSAPPAPDPSPEVGAITGGPVASAAPDPSAAPDLIVEIAPETSALRRDGSPVDALAHHRVPMGIIIPAPTPPIRRAASTARQHNLRVGRRGIKRSSCRAARPFI